MIIKVFPALPLFTKDEQSLFKGICMEFIPGTSGLCTDKGDNPVYLMNKVLPMIRADMTPGGNKEHSYYSDYVRKKYPISLPRCRKKFIVQVIRCSSLWEQLVPGMGGRAVPIASRLSVIGRISSPMRSVLCLLIIVLAVLACGCTSSAPAPTPAVQTTSSAPVIPDLTGTWAGPMKGYDEGIGFSDYSNATMQFIVTGQEDRLFNGRLVFTINGIQESVSVAGVIARDGRSFSMAEKDNGYTTGRILSEDEIELTYLHDATPYSAAIDTLKRE